MSIMYTESIRGYPYMKKETLAEEMHICKGTVVNRLREIENEIMNGRYSDYAIIQDGNILLINVLVFIDFLTYRKRLLNKNLRKNVPPFRPDIIARDIGWNNRVITTKDTEQGDGKL